VKLSCSVFNGTYRFTLHDPIPGTMVRLSVPPIWAAAWVPLVASNKVAQATASAEHGDAVNKAMHGDP